MISRTVKIELVVLNPNCKMNNFWRFESLNQKKIKADVNLLKKLTCM
jgi:hypothetical protein